MRYLTALLLVLAAGCSGDTTGTGGHGFPSPVSLTGTWSAVGVRVGPACEGNTSGSYCYVGYAGKEWDRKRSRYVGSVVVGSIIGDTVVSGTANGRNYDYPVAAHYVGVDSIWLEDRATNASILYRVDSVDRQGTIVMRYTLRLGAAQPEGFAIFTFEGWPYANNTIHPDGSAVISESRPTHLYPPPNSNEFFAGWTLVKH